ncbi:MAG: glycoside hydrolase family 65 protein [Acidimicrobiia bacterium]
MGRPIDIPRDIYPVDEWAVIETQPREDLVSRSETLFALSNGYFGVRGTYDQGEPNHEPGTIVNGFYESWRITYPEPAYGYATKGQTIVRVPDATLLDVHVDGEPLRFGVAGFVCRRKLDLRRGWLEQVVGATTGTGTNVQVMTRRLVSLSNRHLMAMNIEIDVDREAAVEVFSSVVNQQAFEVFVPLDPRHDPRRAPGWTHRVLEVNGHSAEEGRLLATYETARSGLSLACGVDHAVDRENEFRLTSYHDGDRGEVRLGFETTPGRPVRITKFTTYHTGDGHLALKATSTLDEAVAAGWEGVAAEHEAVLARFWEEADVEIDSDAELQQAVRWSLFQLFQSAALIKDAEVPAKGLTSRAYEGHYFWDNEIFVLPFLTHIRPEAAAELIRHRYAMLPQARTRARELSLPGALFAWRTITGEEASAYYLASTAQYHIDAVVVHALARYIEATGDEELLWELGVEIAVETARLWEGLGYWRNDSFHISGVTGPDEYTVLVDDNAFTNVMARFNLRFAVACVERMRREQPARFEQLSDQLGLTSEEPEKWLRAAEAMFIPYDDDTGITPQDESFLQKRVWDFEGVPEDQYPLLLHFHPLTIYRYQVLKQPDVVLAQYLVPDEFPPELQRANFDYYDPLTTGDSSLSAPIQAISAAMVGYTDLALEYFRRSVFVDIGDLHGNAADGVHLASTGGVWMGLIHGFAGLRISSGSIDLDPRLPAAWEGIRFRLCIRNSWLLIDCTDDRVRLSVVRGPDLHVRVRGEGFEVGTEPVEVPLK